MNTSLGLARSSASRAVISLVVLAIARSASGCLANMTVPSRASTTIAARASGTRGGALRRAGGGRGRSGDHSGHGERATPELHSRSLIFWPATSACASSSGFSSWSRSTVVPVSAAMPLRVSSALIV